MEAVAFKTGEHVYIVRAQWEERCSGERYIAYYYADECRVLIQSEDLVAVVLDDGRVRFLAVAGIYREQEEAEKAADETPTRDY